MFVAFDIVAFSTDGNAVLIHEHATDQDGEAHADTYMVVTADSAKPPRFTFSSSAMAEETVSASDCAKASTELTAKLKAVKLVGFSIDGDACKTTARKVVHLDSDVAHVVPSFNAHDQLQMMSAPNVEDGKLLVELHGTDGRNGLVMTPAHARIYVRTGTDFKVLIDELR